MICVREIKDEERNDFVQLNCIKIFKIKIKKKSPRMEIVNEFILKFEYQFWCDEKKKERDGEREKRELFIVLINIEFNRKWKCIGICQRTSISYSLHFSVLRLFVSSFGQYKKKTKLDFSQTNIGIFLSFKIGKYHLFIFRWYGCTKNDTPLNKRSHNNYRNASV